MQTSHQTSVDLSTFNTMPKSPTTTSVAVIYQELAK
jgi:hypothetical protein